MEEAPDIADLKQTLRDKPLTDGQLSPRAVEGVPTFIPTISGTAQSPQNFLRRTCAGTWFDSRVGL